MLRQHRPVGPDRQGAHAQARTDHPRHIGQGCQPVGQPVGVKVKFGQGQIACHGNRSHQIGSVQFAHGRWVGPVGKAVDGGHFGAQGRNKAGRIAAGLHGGNGAGAVVLRCADKGVQRLDPLYRIPERRADPGFHVRGSSAAVGDGDLGLDRAEIRKRLAQKAGGGKAACGNEDQQQQVGGCRMACEPADHWPAPTGFKRMPGKAGAMSSTTTRSPGDRPSRITANPSWRNATVTGRRTSVSSGAAR